MATVLDHSGQLLALVLMVLGMVGVFAAVFLLWHPTPRTEGAGWLLVAAAGAALGVGDMPFQLGTHGRGRGAYSRTTAGRRTVRRRPVGRQ